jgi:hypothetical protein
MTIKQLFILVGILDVAKNVPSTQSRQQLQQELAKAQAMRGMAINCLGNLAQQILDPDVNADFLALTDILGASKLNLCNKTAQCGYNIHQSPQLIEYSDAFDTALANLKESAMTAEFRAISGELDIKTPIQELFKACAVMKSNPQKDKLIEGMKAIRKAEFTAVQICKSLTHGTTPEATELIKDLAADLSQSTNQLIAETKVLYNEPGNLQAAGKLKLISGELEKIGQQMLVEVGQACALHNLRYASKASTASLMKLASASSR